MYKEEFIKEITRICATTADRIMILRPLLHEKEFSKGAYILEEAMAAENIYFIGSGLLRVGHGRKRKMVTEFFLKEGDLMCPSDEIEDKGLSKYDIECIENCKLVYLNCHTLKDVCEDQTELNDLRKNFKEHFEARKWERSELMKIRTREFRYEAFIDSNREFFDRIPLKYLANYLGTRVSTLDRFDELRKEYLSKKASSLAGKYGYT